MKIRPITIAIVLATAISSCTVDTYPLPEETLTGKLICPDGTNLITEQPNGFKIRMNEIVDGKIADIPQDFWGKADGTFRNTRIFEGSYIVQPIEGAFFEVDPVEIDIRGTVNINFEVIPYLTILSDITNNGPDIIARFRIQKADSAGKISKARLLVSKWNPNVGMNQVDFEEVQDLSGLSDDEIIKTTYTLKLLDCMEPGVKYYARIAALSENTSGRYNFSEVIELEY
ncbi:MAG: DUF3823 domain-containing protein [Bacteroidales bacterium]|nr:DUF3823 domain-containing protein [Bacteroidales bacterium]